MQTAMLMTPTALHATDSVLVLPAQGSPTEEQRWRQVMARERTADGSFVYAVSSTGIFCRPSCPSRRPARQRVAFFNSPADAVQAGYRACLRCRPETDESASERRDRAMVAAVLRVMQSNGTERIDLASLSAAVGEARSAILRAFRRTLGTTPARYARHRRMESFRAAVAPPTRLRRGAPRITDAIQDAGFGSSSRLYEVSDAALGMTPTAFQNGGQGVTIRYMRVDSPLGRTLVAATDRGVCAISFSDRDDRLLDELRGQFPRATLLPASGEVEQPGAAATDAEGDPDMGNAARWLAAATVFVLGQLSESPGAARFPFHVRATAFQQRVWAALRAIPRGETVSYARLAQQLALPGGARAVAGACARNPIALAIPCHRVVRESGALAGYRWGIDRKRMLLDREVLTGAPGEGVQGRQPAR